jgi:hypothetical protein
MNPYKRWSNDLPNNLPPEEWEKKVKERALREMGQRKRIIKAGDLVRYQKAASIGLSGHGVIVPQSLIGLVTEAKFDDGKQFIKILWSEPVPDGYSVPDSKEWWFSTSVGKWKILNR